MYLSKEDTNHFFIEENFRSASNEDANQFLIWEKIKSTSNEDANQFFIWEKFISASNEDANQFLIKKNSYLYLMKMPISLFYFILFYFLYY